MTAASTRSPGKVLLADIGGTNARFAVLAGGTVGMVAHMAVRKFGGFREALGAYLGGLPEVGRIGGAILAAAGVVQNGRCALTNSSWVIDADELRAAHGFSTVRLINDFEAVGWALPVLSRDQLLQIGGGSRSRGRRWRRSAPARGLEWRSASRTPPVTSCFRARVAIRRWPAARRGRML